MAAACVDLHCHSTASDGTLMPAEVVRLAQRVGLTALALTDHDTMAGIAEAAAEAAAVGIKFLPGIEISAEYPRPGTLHILGYGMHQADPALRQLMRKLQASRAERNPRIVARLNEMGLAVTLDEWRLEAGDGVMGRPHLAAVLVRKGHATSMRDAFNRFIGETAPAYFDKERLTAAQAFSAIRSAGGIAVLAHPSQLRCDLSQIEQMIRQFMEQGLEGVEVIHSDFNDELVRFLTGLADRLGLLKTGGSDFHGGNKPAIELGRANGREIPQAYFDALMQRLKSKP